MAGMRRNLQLWNRVFDYWAVITVVNIQTLCKSHLGSKLLHSVDRLGVGKASDK